MVGGYIHAAIANKWLRLHRLVGILSRSALVGYAAQLSPSTNCLTTGQQRLLETAQAKEDA